MAPSRSFRKGAFSRAECRVHAEGTESGVLIGRSRVSRWMSQNRWPAAYARVPSDRELASGRGRRSPFKLGLGRFAEEGRARSAPPLRCGSRLHSFVLLPATARS